MSLLLPSLLLLLRVTPFPDFICYHPWTLPLTYALFARSYFRFGERRSREMGEESRRGHQEGRGSRRQHVAALYVFISFPLIIYLCMFSFIIII